MRESNCNRRKDDPYEAVPTWRVEGLERRVERLEQVEHRLEREAGQHVSHVEGRLNRLSQTWLENYLIQLVIFAAMVFIVAVASHH